MAFEGYEKLRVGVEGGIATVTIDNPPINLFDLGLFLEMRQIATELHDDGAVREVGVRSATPGLFIAHCDVSLIQSFPPEHQPEPTEHNPLQEMCEAFRTMPK